MSEDSMYWIRPLVWKREADSTCQHWTAKAAFGRFAVSRWRDNSRDQWGPWKWMYYPDETRNILLRDCESAKDGQALCEAYWRQLLQNALQEVAR